MGLTPHQAEVGNNVIIALRKGAKRIILKGSAGVGKTFLVGELVKAIKKDFRINTDYNNGVVFATAPTNKALAVLQRKIDAKVEFKTIHSAFKMRMYTNSKTGVRKFIPTYSKIRGNESDFRKAKACILDECSMVNTEFVGGYRSINGESEYVQGHLDMVPNVPIIFVGDSKQLNPVLESISPIWNKDYPTFELIEIIRQGEGNPIIDLSRDIDLLYFKEPNIIDGKGYLYNNDRSTIIETLAEVNGTDEVKYLTYTNDDVDAINIAVRNRIYKNPEKIELGEILVFNSPLGDIYTSKEVKVEALEIVTDLIPVAKYDTKFDKDDMPINTMDNVKMKFYRVNNSFMIVHEQSEQLFKTISKYLENNCNKRGWNWKAYYNFTELFADTKYNHAITVHKSQGSTYNQAIINIENIHLNRNTEERQRLLYTAITRASDLVILNNVK